MSKTIDKICTLGIAAAAAGCVLGSASIANADASCNALVQEMASLRNVCSGCVITVTAQHTVNFFQFVNGINDIRRGSYGLLSLRVFSTSLSLSGSGNELFSDRFTDTSHRQPFDFRQPSTTTFDLVFEGPNAGKVFINFSGPHDPVCFSNRFMVIATPTSVETFSLAPPNLF